MIPDQDLTPRQLEERRFFSRERWPFENWVIDEGIIPWNMREFERILGEAIGGLHALEGKRVLDCGCGWGISSVLLAKRGARVSAVDISFECVNIAKRLAKENCVDDRLDVRQGVIEKLDFKDAEFDVIVGTRVLHHVDIAKSRHELYRVLKQSGLALFYESTYRNRPYVFSRNLWRRIPIIPFGGSKYEHPLTREEVESLNEVFNGTLTMHAAPYAIISHLTLVLLRGKLPAAERAAGAVDRFIDKAFPFLRNWGLHQILLMRK